jgi:hypothetical protein
MRFDLREQNDVGEGLGGLVTDQRLGTLGQDGVMEIDSVGMHAVSSADDRLGQ